jgi:hypothetical protein
MEKTLKSSISRKAAKNAKTIGTQIHTAPSTRSGQANTDSFTAENAKNAERSHAQYQHRKLKPQNECSVLLRLHLPRARAVALSHLCWLF